MTREEAIRELNTFKIGAKSELGETALDMAIKALEQQTCEDCISRQAAIDAVFSLCEDCDSGYCGSCRVNYPGEKDARKALEDLPSAQPEQRWIPCSERLPEDGEDIIVTYVDDEETRIIPVNYDKGTWYDCIFDTALNPIKVIAWMPLPEPYREERTEE